MEGMVKNPVFLALSALLLPSLLSAQKADPNETGNSVDHAGIIKSLDGAGYARGKSTYENLCANCHGNDGRTPALPISPAFGKGPFKFGDDPYSMFVTLTKGNGLMGPQTWMSPRERYEVIHYLRESFMKPSYPGYKPVSEEYLDELPKVTVAPPPKKKLPNRDFGPALASQLGRDLSSALTISLGDDHTISYDLHTMDLAGLWKGGFLDLSNTQHYRERGGGVPLAKGEPIPGLDAWKWAHEGTFDYPTENLLPRGPIPSKWMDYHGHYLHESHVILSYSINGRKILEMPSKPRGFGAIAQALRVEPGKRPSGSGPPSSRVRTWFTATFPSGPRRPNWNKTSRWAWPSAWKGPRARSAGSRPYWQRAARLPNWIRSAEPSSPFPPPPKPK